MDFFKQQCIHDGDIRITNWVLLDLVAQENKKE